MMSELCTEVFVGHKVAEKSPLSGLPSQCTAHNVARVGSGPCSVAGQAMESLRRTSANAYIHSSAQHRLQDNRLVPFSPYVYKERMNLRPLDLSGVY